MQVRAGGVICLHTLGSGIRHRVRRRAKAANHAFDVFDNFFDFSVSGLLPVEDQLTEPGICGSAAVMFLQGAQFVTVP